MLCGDSAKITALEKLVNEQKASLYVTDPPYGVSYADKNRNLNNLDEGTRIENEIQGDHKNQNEIKQLWLDVFKKCLNSYN